MWGTKWSASNEISGIAADDRVLFVRAQLHAWLTSKLTPSTL